MGHKSVFDCNSTPIKVIRRKRQDKSN